MNFFALSDAVLKATTQALGVEVVYTPVIGSAQTIQAVWDRDYVQVDPNTGAAVTSTQPRIGVRLADLDVTPKKGDTVVVAGSSLKVIDVQVDGQGGATLYLHKV